MTVSVSIPSHPLAVLRVDASSRRQNSHTRVLADELVRQLEKRYGQIALTRRDLVEGVAFVNEAWIDANSTEPDHRNPTQREALAGSDALVAELAAADVLVIATPMYNFSIPAALKAWVDMVARARVTFRYTADGPVGMLANKKTYVLMATGGVPLGSALDFATPYLRHVLGFLGIQDVTFIGAEQVYRDAEAAVAAAREQITTVVNVNQAAIV